MFERIIGFLGDLPIAGGKAGRLEDDDPRVAAAALLIHVISADGICNATEQTHLKTALARAYNISGAELRRLIKAAEEAEAETVDPYTLTGVLKRNLGPEARAEFIRLMWEIVLSDGDLHELEDNLVWRVAELIDVDASTRLAMRQKAEDQKVRQHAGSKTKPVAD